MVSEIQVRSRDDDQTLQDFIQSKPTSFLILGKKSSGKSVLASQISKNWNCKHVSFANIFEEELAKETELLGKSNTTGQDDELPDDSASQHSEINNGVNPLSHLLSSPNTNTVLGKFTKLQLKLWQGEMITDEEVVACLEEAVQSETCQHYGYVLDDLPWSDPDIALTKIKQWQLQPDIIIDINIPGEDLVERRTGFRQVAETGDVLKSIQFDKDERTTTEELWKKAHQKHIDELDPMANGEEEEEEAEEDLDEPDHHHSDIPQNFHLIDFPYIENSEKLETRSDRVKRIEDHPDALTLEFEKYSEQEALTNVQIFGTHDQLKVIKLDGLQPPTAMYKQVESILLELSGRLISPPSISPVRLVPGPDEDDIPDEMDDEQLFRAVAKYARPGPTFRWKKSMWGRYCPVDLFEKKQLILGSPQCACSFLGKIYVMSSKENVNKFIDNPRKYLTNGPTIPKRLVIFGDVLSNADKICESLAEKYNARLIRPMDGVQERLNKKIAAEKDEKRHALLHQAKEEVRERTNSAKLEAYTKLLQEYEVGTAEGQTDLEHPGEAPAIEELEIDPDSEPVQARIEELMKTQDFTQIKLSTEEICTCLPKLEDNNESWIFYNFPKNVEHLKSCEAYGYEPDDFIYIRDNTQGYAYSTKKHFDTVLSYDDREQWREAYNKRCPDLTPLQHPLCLPPDSIEFEPKRLILSNGDQEWTSLKAKVTNRSSAVAGSRAFFEPKEISLRDVDETDENIIHRAVTEIDVMMENRFQYTASDYSGNDVEEEEEDQAALIDVLEKSENTEFLGDVDPSDVEAVKRVVRHFGTASKYDIVDLVNGSVFFPGTQDLGAKYRDKLYFFRNEENHRTFLNDPQLFTPESSSILDIPPPRIFIVGSQSSGKSYISKAIAKRYGLFHFDFKVRLQELILSKVRRKIGIRYHEERELERVKSINIEKAVNELVDVTTDFRDLMTQLNTISTEFQEAGENKDKDVDVVDMVKRMKNDSEFDENKHKPEQLTLDEFSEGIHDALDSDRALESYHLKPILEDLWNKEPWKSTGFVLEGFPRHNSDVGFLEENCFWPDCCIVLQSTANECISRQLENQIQLFREKSAYMMNLREALKKQRQKLRDEQLAKRREQLVEKREGALNKRRYREALLEEQRAEAVANGEDPEAVTLSAVEEGSEEEFDLDHDMDIDLILQREYTDYFSDINEDDVMLGFDELEDPGEALDRIRTELESQHEISEASTVTVSEACEEFRIRKLVLETTGLRKEVVRNKVMNRIQSLVFPQRQNIFEQPTMVTLDVASKMLETGYAKLSPYGRLDCVLMESGQVEKWHAPNSTDTMYPVLHNEEIFFFTNVDTRGEFMKEPTKYTKKATTVSTLPFKIPIRMAIVGPTKCGKTTLANRFSAEQNLLRISLGEATRRILSLFPKSDLARRINTHLLIGETVPVELQIDAVELWLLDAVAQRQGYCFDGFPTTFEQVQKLSLRGILPMCIVELDVTDEECLARSIQDRMTRESSAQKKHGHELIMHDSADIIAQRISNYRLNMKPVRYFYKNEHQNWHIFPAKINRWLLWKQVEKKVMFVTNDVQTFVKREKLNQAARLRSMCVMPSELNAHLEAELQHLCPVSLKDANEVFDQVAVTSFDNSAKYKDTFYRLASDEKLEKFLQAPDSYVGLKGIPNERVEILAEITEDPAFGGYCPVHYGHTGQLVFGLPIHAGKYKNKVYVFSTKDGLAEFIKKPESYSEPTIKLPMRVPPIPQLNEKSHKITDLPALGYLEQGCAKAITAALAGVSSAKPKIPWMSVEQSALLYTACYLKAYNSNASEYSRKKYKQNLSKIEEQSNLLTYLSSTMTRRYREPSQRDEKFDDKMKEFYSLRRDKTAGD